MSLPAQPAGHPAVAAEPSHTDVSAGQPGFDGSEIRTLRKVRRMSLTEFSEKVGLSVGYLSQIERNISVPSVKALTAIARALDVTVGWFFSGGRAGPSDEKGFVVRRDNRRRIIFRDGFVDYLLSPSLDGKLELVLTHFKSGASTGEPFTHLGEEGGMVLQGRLEITAGDRQFIIEEGDSFTFSSTAPHAYRNVYDGETIVMYALTPPTY